MREVLLRMKEQDKYSVIKEPVDHGGNKKRATLRLSLSVRQVNRLIIVYRKKEKPASYMVTETGNPLIPYHKN